MTPEWKRILKETFDACRWEPRWADLYDLHDEEDRAYFQRLEENSQDGYSFQ